MILLECNLFGMIDKIDFYIYTKIIYKLLYILFMNKPEDTDDISKKSIQESRIGFNKMLSSYLESNPAIQENGIAKEFEIRFGSNRKLSKPISKIDYDNVSKVLKSCGFKPEFDNIDGSQVLKIQNEYIDKNTGATKISNIRTEITGEKLVKDYCKTNSIEALINSQSFHKNSIKFVKKSNAMGKDGPIKPIDIKEFNFRASFQNEQGFQPHSGLSKQIINNWNDSKKIFRFLNRVRWEHPDYPLYVDMSIVKESSTKNYVQVPKYTIQESNTFKNVEKFNVEIELNNTKIYTYKQDDVSKLVNDIKKVIRIILGALQNTKFPISYIEIQNIKEEYFKLLHYKEGDKNNKIEIPKKLTGSHFIGPSSLTLQNEHLIPDTPNNILTNYTVTDKADGERSLLFINSKGHIYMIDKNLEVMYTGSNTETKNIFSTIIDGEFIKYDKHKNIINLFACFDIYIINKKDVRQLPFTYSDSDDTENQDLIDTKKTRLQYLNAVVNMIKSKSVLEKKDNSKPTHFVIKCKTFYSTNEGTIFSGCSTILSNVKDNLFNYNTDGLIFTPSDLPVGGTEIDKPGPLRKHTWSKSFKWKPPEFNTIDFLVSIKKDSSGRDEIHNIFVDGKSLDKNNKIKQYKTLELRCGYDPKKHGYMNPYQDILDGNLPNKDYYNDDNENYKPVPFMPTNPYQENSHLCNIFINTNNNKSYILTEPDDDNEKQYIEENMIVEFKYDKTRPDGFKWVPIRVRNDKTSELRAGIPNYGNPFYVANSNWHTIHFPITENMLTTGENIPDEFDNSDTYYNHNVSNTVTQKLRNFHNFIKKNLITAVSKRNDTLIDYSVGRGGDLHKWDKNNLSFVYGIDYSPDNIHNVKSGTCARYLNEYKKNKKLPKVIFSVGDTSQSIIDGLAFDNDKDKKIFKAITGQGPKDKELLGQGVYDVYGIAKNGFNIGSSQFSLHYYFESHKSLHNFLKNISDTIKVDGYFIGTCFDGRTVFNKLKDKTIETGFTIMHKNKKMFEIIKMYTETGFPDDHTSIGYPINVYQESIDNYHREFLVNFDYLVQLMDDYGFNLLEDTESKNLGFISSTSLFSDYYDYVKNDKHWSSDFEKQYNYSINMSQEEKNVSFLNRYFIFKKVRNVDTNKINKLLIQTASIENIPEPEIQPEIPIKPKAKKTKKKIRIDE